LIYSLQNLISPGLLTMSYYFGFEGNKSQLATLTFCFTLVSGGSMIIFGYMADKFERTKILVLGNLIFSSAAVVTIIVPPDILGYRIFFIFQLIAGFGFGAIVPTTFSLMGDMISVKDRAKGFSFYSIATLIGTTVGVLMGTLLLSVDWRLSYTIIGIVGLAMTPVLLSIKEPNRIGKDYLLTAGKEVVEYTYRIKISDLKEIFSKRTNFWLIVNFVDTIPTGIILFLLFAYLKEIHNVPETFGLFYLAFVIVSTLVGTVIFGYIGDILFERGNKKARVLLALFANVAPIPFVFISLNIPFIFPDNGSLLQLFMMPMAILMLILMCVGLFINGATNGCWYATVVDINLPEHRGTTLATANFFDIIGRAIGPLLGGILADKFGMMIGINTSIIFWLAIPLFWVGVLKNVIPDMLSTEKVFKERLKKLQGK
ncbi:MAG: MFS transporter, partial [Promethearchaeota archaeon]